MVRLSKSQLVTSILLLAFLLSPFLILGLHFRPSGRLDWEDIRWAGGNTILQALGSAVISTICGLTLALGMMKLAPASLARRLIEYACLSFNFLPALFVLVFALDLFDGFFPMGILGIVLVHTLINFGLVAVLLARMMERQFSSMTAVAFIEGASRWQVLTALARPLTRICFQIGFFVFVVCIASFTVPLMVGGRRGTTLEVLIYEKVRISSDFSSALYISILQGLFVLALSLLLPRLTSTAAQGHNRVWVLPSRVLLGLLSVVLVGCSIYFFMGMITGWRQVQMIPGLSESIIDLIPRTVLQGSAVGGLAGFLFLIQSYVSASSWVHRSVSGLVSLSPALAAFSFFLLAGDGHLGSLFICLGCLFYPMVFRLGGRATLRSLRQQQEVAHLMGATPLLIFSKITLPQVASSFALMSGVAAIWAMGDFAISKVLMAQEISLGMLASNLMSTYRIEAAFAVCGLILLLGVVPLLFFQGMAYVLRQTFS